MNIQDLILQNRLSSNSVILPACHYTQQIAITLRLNMYLCEEPSVPELRYAIATRHSMRRRVSVHTRAVVDFNFGAAPVNSESSTVHLMVENEGDVATEWYVHTNPHSQAFSYP